MPSQVNDLFPLVYRTGFDWESHLIGPGQVIPKGVCLSIAFEGTPGEAPQTELGTTGDAGSIEPMLDALFPPEPPFPSAEDFDPPEGTRPLLAVAHNAAFDLAQSLRYAPNKVTDIFNAIEQGRVHCTKIREKLLNLTLHGMIDYLTEDESSGNIDYSQAGLLKAYTGVDKSALKEGDDIWRLNYSMLDGKPMSEWPPDAISYAIGDSVDCLIIHEHQERRRLQCIEERGIDPFLTQDFRVMADFCLYLQTAWGVMVDPVEKQKVEAFLLEELKPERLQLIIAAGILRPAEEPRPFKKGAKNPDGSPKMTKGKEESVNKKVFAQYVMDLAAKDPEMMEGLKYTAPTDKFPDGQLQLDKAFLEDWADSDPTLSEYAHRQSLQKLVTTEIPRMNWEDKTAPIIYSNYDILKVSGRTSSYAGKKPLYPSFNSQNVHPRVRNIVVPRPGTLLFGIDIASMELCTLAQKCLDLFGHSVMADKINAGEDLHAFLGAQIAYASHQGFHDWCDEQGATTTDQRAALFGATAKGDADEQTFFKHYRKLAKPTGLGYPGGLGARKFIAYAKSTFGVVIDLETAKMLKEVWLDTFPEMVEYFEYVNTMCVDPNHDAVMVEVDGKPRRNVKYAYTTSFGMHRPNCNYCAIANGMGLQSNSAEGAITGNANIVRACFDPSLGSILYGGAVRPILFIHDENVGEIEEGDGSEEALNLRHARIVEMQRIMQESMRLVTPGVASRTAAVLMRRWDKNAEPVFDAQGRLTVWEPKAKKEVA